MRIFHVITLSSLGGAQSVVVNLANEQSKNNEVYVISSSSGEAWTALSNSVHIIKMKELRREISWRDIIVFLKLLYYRIKYKPDIVHLHSSKIGAIGRVAFPSNKTLYTVHGFDSIRVANRKFLQVELLLQKFCSYIVGVSLYDVKMMAVEGVCHNVKCIYNGIKDIKYYSQDDEDMCLYAEQVAIIRTRYKKVVMCIARDDPPKDVSLFLRVANMFKDEGVAFVWVGNKSEYNGSDNTFFIGTVPMGYRLLTYADVFVLMSHFEGLPMSIIEAMSMRKPIVASDVGGISELLNGENGFAVKNDADEFAEKIRFLLDNPKRYDSMSHNARLMYEKYFTVNQMVSSYNDIYNEIARNNE